MFTPDKYVAVSDRFTSDVAKAARLPLPPRGVTTLSTSSQTYLYYVAYSVTTELPLSELGEKKKNAKGVASGNDRLEEPIRKLLSWHTGLNLHWTSGSCSSSLAG